MNTETEIKLQAKDAFAPLSLYIHWPFCKKKCPYCDFNSHVRENVEFALWKQSLLTELRVMAAKLDKPHQLVSIFFGGGTPSLMPADIAEALISQAKQLWPYNPETLEITLEANPTSSESQKFAAFAAAGVNRLSLGVQSLYDTALGELGREHSAKEALAAVEMAAEMFPRHSFDLIYARPNQTVQAWEDELRAALPYSNGHLSLYQLTIEEGTAFKHLHDQGKLILPDDDRAVEFYQVTADVLADVGMAAYEISNYAKAGAESRHNMAYWLGDSYIGIGPGAHGRMEIAGTVHATSMLKSPERWLQQVAQNGHGLEHNEPLSADDRAEEMVLSGLRLAQGISRADFAARAGMEIDTLMDAKALQTLQEQGLVTDSQTHVQLTPSGLLLLDSVVAFLLR